MVDGACLLLEWGLPLGMLLDLSLHSPVVCVWPTGQLQTCSGDFFIGFGCLIVKGAVACVEVCVQRVPICIIK